MGFAVVHLEKAKGSDSGMSAHIERTIAPKNADETRTHLNREFIEFPDGVENRTQAIQHRLDTAGLTRKIGTNQVRAIRVMLSGTHEDMAEIENNGRLDEWCSDNLNWLRQTFGADNVVSAVLHLDEKTPHIHATVVPIVTTERVKRKREESAKRTYRKKTPSARLCCDEVMGRLRLEKYQDDYAIAMAKYGLKRGRRGSDARHKSTAEHYKDLQEQSESIQENITELLEQQATAKKELSATKSAISKEKLKNSVADVGSKILDGASSLLGTSKVKRLEAENERLRGENTSLIESAAQEKEVLKSQYQRENRHLYEQYQVQQKEWDRREQQLKQENSRLLGLLDKIFKWFPKVAEYLRVESLCKQIGFATEQISKLFKRESIIFNGTTTNPETRHKYRVNGLSAHIENDTTNSNKLNLILNGQEQSEWFKEQQHRRMFPQHYPTQQNRGMKI